MAPNGSSRTPFDDDLVTDPGTPKDTQPLPAQPDQGAYRARPSRLLPAQPSNASPPTPPPTIPNIVSQGGTPVGNAGNAPSNTSPLSLKKTPLSTIIGLSAVGGALAVLILAAIVGRVVHRTLAIAHPPTAPDAGIMMGSPTPVPIPATGAIGDDGSQAAVPMPDQNASASTPLQSATPSKRSEVLNKPKRPTSDEAASFPADNTGVPTKPNSTTQEDQTTGHSAAPTDDQPATKEGKDRTEKPSPRGQDGAASTSEDNTSVQAASPHRFNHSRSSYSVTPPPDFKLVQRGHRTIWKGPNDATFLVETTSKPGRTPFGDWLRLDSMLRKKYGVHYRSHGIDQTTLAGRPAAIWDFEIDTKQGPVRKIDIAVHHNGKGYAILGSAPLLKFDAVRPQIESAINSFQLPQTHDQPSKRHHHSEEATQDQSDSQTNSDNSSAPITANDNLAREDLRPDAGY